jgi:MFS family permease
VLASAAWLSGRGLLLAAIAPGPLVAYLGFGLVGLGASVVAPLALALAGQAADPARRTLAVSRAMLLGYMGFVVGPPLLGLVSDSFGLRAAFGLAALSVLAVPLVLLPHAARGSLRPQVQRVSKSGGRSRLCRPRSPRPVRRTAPWSCRVPCG